MKNRRAVFTATAIAIIFVLALIACDDGNTDNNNGGTTPTLNVTPTAADFTVSGLSYIYDGSRKTVTIMPKEGKSTGKITVYYI